MQKKTAPIGVMDSGVGGLSVVTALRQILPYEDILYFGDTANCPYGNKTREQLLNLSGNMLAYLTRRGVKCVALACNTTSSLAPILRERVDVPIITIAESAADTVTQAKLKRVGVIATVFTVGSGIYDRCIREASPDTAVDSVGSPNLAALVENAATTDAQFDAEIRACMDELLLRAPVEDVILGCTHYPLVLDRFRACYPALRFHDPAPQQAKRVLRYLTENEIANEPHRAKLTVFTTGDPEVFREKCEAYGYGETYDMEFLKV